MSTRSTIALELPNGMVGQIYCHYDGYLSHNGKILLEHYNTPAKIAELIELGDISVLAPEIGVKHDFNERVNTCKFYGRDRGDTDTEARAFESVENYKNNYQHEEYNYLMTRDGVLLVSFGSYVDTSPSFHKTYVEVKGRVDE